MYEEVHTCKKIIEEQKKIIHDLKQTQDKVLLQITSNRDDIEELEHKLVAKDDHIKEVKETMHK